MQFITISRKLGTDASKIAKRVADKLEYKFHETKSIETMAQEMGFLDDVRGVDDKPPSGFMRYFSSKPEIQVDRLCSVIYELASRGSAVFLGRGGHILLRSYECALHVRVTASLEYRIQNLIQRGILREAAEEMIRRSDQERSAFIKMFFNADWENPELYDIVLNMNHLSEDLAVDTVLHMARSEEIEERSMEAMRSLETISLVQRARAALSEASLLEGRISYPVVSVTEPGCVQLTGIVTDRSTKKKMEEILGRVKGVKEIDNKIHVMNYYGT